MDDELKLLIKKRQAALTKGDTSSFKYYRNLVNTERKKCRQKYYHAKIKNLKHTKPRDWWHCVKKISGMEPVAKPNFFENVVADEVSGLSHGDMVNRINEIFLEPLQSFQPLDELDGVTNFNCDENTESITLSVTEEEVFLI